MYEDLIKRLRFAARWAEYGLVIPPSVCLEAADAIEELQKQRDEWESHAALAESFARGWIPVTERLPEIDEKHHCSKDVLAYLKDGGMCFTALEENIFGQACFECERNPAVEEEMIVTHWMPLPEPPKEEET